MNMKNIMTVIDAADRSVELTEKIENMIEKNGYHIRTITEDIRKETDEEHRMSLKSYRMNKCGLTDSDGKSVDGSEHYIIEETQNGKKRELAFMNKKIGKAFSRFISQEDAEGYFEYALSNRREDDDVMEPWMYPKKIQVRKNGKDAEFELWNGLPCIGETIFNDETVVSGIECVDSRIEPDAQKEKYMFYEVVAENISGHETGTFYACTEKPSTATYKLSLDEQATAWLHSHLVEEIDKTPDQFLVDCKKKLRNCEGLDMTYEDSVRFITELAAVIQNG